MKTFVQPGRSITVAAPMGGVTSGAGVLIGNLFGIAQGDALDTEDVEILTEGVAEIAKTSALAISVGDRLFWDNTNKVVNKTAAAQVCVGVAVTVAANPSAIVRMKLAVSTPAGT